MLVLLAPRTWLARLLRCVPCLWHSARAQKPSRFPPSFELDVDEQKLHLAATCLPPRGPQGQLLDLSFQMNLVCHVNVMPDAEARHKCCRNCHPVQAGAATRCVMTTQKLSLGHPDLPSSKSPSLQDVSQLKVISQSSGTKH
jgi:hypothetical protein